MKKAKATTYPLTDSDRKVLKDEKRIGLTFALVFLAFTALLNVCVLLIPGLSVTTVQLVVIDILLVATAFLIYWLINRKAILSLRSGEKRSEPAYEVGSAALYIPLLGNLFPKLWGPDRMKQVDDNYYIVVNYTEYRVGKDVYDFAQDSKEVEMHYSLPGNVFLGFYPAR